MERDKLPQIGQGAQGALLLRSEAGLDRKVRKPGSRHDPRRSRYVNGRKHEFDLIRSAIGFDSDGLAYSTA